MVEMRGHHQNVRRSLCFISFRPCLAQELSEKKKLLTEQQKQPFEIIEGNLLAVYCTEDLIVQVSHLFSNLQS